VRGPITQLDGMDIPIQNHKLVKIPPTLKQQKPRRQDKVYFKGKPRNETKLNVLPVGFHCILVNIILDTIPLSNVFFLGSFIEM
jgi:hypothetical protein